MEKNLNENGHTLLLPPPNSPSSGWLGWAVRLELRQQEKNRGKAVLIFIVLPCAVQKPLFRVKKPIVELEGVITRVQRSQ